jgi:hypothetical protein
LTAKAGCSSDDAVRPSMRSDRDHLVAISANRIERWEWSSGSSRREARWLDNHLGFREVYFSMVAESSSSSLFSERSRSGTGRELFVVLRMT